MRAVPTPASTQSTVHCPHVHCPQPAVHCPPTVHFRRRASATAREPEQREGRRATAEGGGRRGPGKDWYQTGHRGCAEEFTSGTCGAGGGNKTERISLLRKQVLWASWGKPDGYLNSRPSRQKTRPTRGKPASRRGGHAADRQRECECKSEAQLGPPDLSRSAPLFSRTRPSQAGLSSIDGVRACRATPTG